ncbi:DUF6160 family protein [uncultured Marinobacter sp.]|uniref:DUF6160 family protein n=1 Tax=uncultured Marinobacter sp. TaxID=187379 RepID=UPI00259A64A4|nr:DUF6160 family protein [uncultured Marinobacter sp.]
MTKLAYGCAALATLLLGISPVAQAELEPISDNRMGEVTGQAFMNIENIPGNGVDYTRMTLGIDVETRVNIDDIQVGQIDGGTDFSAQHLALGHIARNDGETFNGVTYNEGEAIPFEARKPYIELAEDSAGLKGFRMGFAEARGSVSSYTESFSGALPGLKIRGDDGNLYDGALYAGAGLEETSRRATHVGLKVSEGGNCAAPSLCAPLTNLRSVIVGEDAGVEGNSAFTDAFFMVHRALPGNAAFIFRKK